MKRGFDVLAASLALVVLSPVLAVTALLVRFRLGSPVLFRQERAGRYGATFTLVKFRSMLEGTGSDSERSTPFGRRLRSSSLDELPELINIIRGDMSVVGPRPLLPEYLPLYSERQARRHDVRPGLTGSAQIAGRNTVGWAQRLELDVEYVESYSFLGDLGIIGATLRSVLQRDGIDAADGAPMERFMGTDEVSR